MIKYGIKNSDNDNFLIIKQIDELIDIIESNDGLIDILGEINRDDLKNALKLFIFNSHYDLNNISEDEKLEIIENVLLEYV